MSCQCDAHPLDHQTRQSQEAMTSQLAQYVVPGLREDDLRQLEVQGKARRMATSARPKDSGSVDQVSLRVAEGIEPIRE